MCELYKVDDGSGDDSDDEKHWHSLPRRHANEQQKRRSVGKATSSALNGPRGVSSHKASCRCLGVLGQMEAIRDRRRQQKYTHTTEFGIIRSNKFGDSYHRDRCVAWNVKDEDVRGCVFLSLTWRF